MDAKNRKQQQRKKLKENKEKYELHLALERERDRKRRDVKKMLMDKESLEEKRKNDRERKRKSRQRKKDENQITSVLNTSEIGTFKSQRSLKKAVTKVKRNLPQSPSKRTAVMKQLFKEFPSESVVPPVNRRIKIPVGDIEKIRRFFLRDDISRQAPGMKDVKLVKNAATGSREKI